MSKNRKSILFLGVMFILVVGMMAVYGNFLNDKPLIIKQEQQSQGQSLSPGDVLNGIKGFFDATTSNIKPPPPITP